MPNYSELSQSDLERGYGEAMQLCWLLHGDRASRGYLRGLSRRMNKMLAELNRRSNLGN